MMLRAFKLVNGQTQRLFSCLQVTGNTPITNLVTPHVQRTCVRFKFLATRQVRKFRPLYGKDKVTKDWMLIYDNNLNRPLFWSQVCIYSMTIPSNLTCAWIVAKNIADIPSKLTIAHPASSALAYAVFGMSLLLFMSAVSRRHILRIYRDPISNRNIAIVQNWAMIPRKLEFELKDCSNRESSLLKSWAGHVNIKGRPFYVFADDFSLPKYYNQLRGWENDRYIEEQKNIDIRDVFHSERLKRNTNSIKKQ